MKIGLLQLNVKNDDPADNSDKIAAAVTKNAGADLYVAPLSAVFGPDERRFRDDPRWRARRDDSVNSLAARLKNSPPLICGAPGREPLLISGGTVLELPDAFDFADARVAFSRRDGAPVAADVVLDLNAWAYSPGEQRKREQRLSPCSRDAALVAVNLVGGYDQWVYAGHSFVLRGGEPLARAAAFREEVLICDLTASGAPLAPTPDILAGLWDALVLGTRDFLRKLGATGAILGLSGGMDSALVACVAAEAVGPENVTAILMPSPWSSEGSVSDSLALAANLGVKTATAPIEPAMSAYNAILDDALHALNMRKSELAVENLQARIRGVLLMAVANCGDALVLNTGNKSEIAMGYSTLYGDSVGALAVIGDLYKTRVYELARAYNARNGEIIPTAIIEKAPSAELRPGQKDTDSLPPYDELDPVLEKIFAGDSLESGELEIRKRVIAAGFKRLQAPPALLVGGDSIGSWEKRR